MICIGCRHYSDRSCPAVMPTALPTIAMLASFPSGSWLSDRCESQVLGQLGMFALRMAKTTTV